MNECVNSENVGQVEELLLMTEQMQDELDQKDQTILELNRQNAMHSHHTVRCYPFSCFP